MANRRGSGRRRSGPQTSTIVFRMMTIMGMTTEQSRLDLRRFAKTACLPRDVLKKAVVSRSEVERRFHLTAARENLPPCDLLSRGSIAPRASVSR